MNGKTLYTPRAEAGHPRLALPTPGLACDLLRPAFRTMAQQNPNDLPKPKPALRKIDYD